MIKIVFLSFLFFSGITFSQTYNFNFVTKYSSKNLKTNQKYEIINYFNSGNFGYNLRLFKVENDFYAYLVDFKTKTLHKFSVKENKENNEIIFNFFYVSSIYTGYDVTNYRNYRFEFSKQEDKKFLLKIFRSKKAKRPEEEIVLNLKNANTNLFPIFRIAALHPFEAVNDFNIEGNFVVEKAIYNNKKQNIYCEIRLEEYRNINLEIMLPKKLEYSDFQK